MSTQPGASPQTHPPTDALALLAIPAYDGLTQAQRRGADCVWDGITLAPETAVILGDRPIRPGGHFTWYPRACRHCIYTAAYRQLHAHVPGCQNCPNGNPGCATAVGLLRLMRNYR